MKILILASNPRNDLDLNQEIRDLKDVIDTSRNRQEFEVEDALAVRVDDLQELLLKHQPQIVHFCGHGGGQTGLVFEGRNGGEQWVRTEALRDLFRLFSSKVGCVLLNACYSEEQANEIVNHIDYVIGMNQAIRDDAAIAFAKGFYRALGYNCSIEEAYEFGCNAIQLEISGSSVSRDAVVERKLNAANMVTSEVIPEHLKPTLKKSKQVNSSNRWREGTTKPPPLSQEERGELQQEVVRAVTGFGPNAGTSAQPQRLSTPAAPPSLTSRRFSPLVLGGLAACLIPAIGFYGYQQWQKQPPVPIDSEPKVEVDSKPSETTIADRNSENPPPKNPEAQTDRDTLNQAIEFYRIKEFPSALRTLSKIPANSTVSSQAKEYLKICSEKLHQQAQASYEKGNIEDALKDAREIPPDSPTYKDIRAEMIDWNNDQKTFDEIKKGSQTLGWDPAVGRRQLEKLKSPGLKSRAEKLIPAVEKPNPQPPPNPPKFQTDSQAGWQDYKYAWLSQRPVTETDLRGKSPTELDVMRNSIYAKYGFIFGDNALNAAFIKEPWYKPTRNESEVDKLLSPLETANAVKIRDFQKQKPK
jgi:YARHG domain/CHAT domain